MPLVLASCGPGAVLGDPDESIGQPAWTLVGSDWGWSGMELAIAGDYGASESLVRFVFPGAEHPVAPSLEVGRSARVIVPEDAATGWQTITVLVDGEEVGQVKAEILDEPIVECSQPPGRICCDAETPDCHRCHAIARAEAAWWKQRCGGVEW